VVLKEYEILVDSRKEVKTSDEEFQYSDYVLLGKTGKPKAVVEAKKTSKDETVMETFGILSRRSTKEKTK
jgi:type I restriction enzyme, R subunit